MKRRAIFFDKDGTLVENVPYNIDPALIRFNKGAYDALLSLSSHLFQFHVVTNQAGIALGHFEEEDMKGVRYKLEELFLAAGAELTDFHYCPHHPEGKISHYKMHCECRKPQCGMLVQAARKYGIDLKDSWLVGDILDDVEAGKRAGCRTILIDNGNETEWFLNTFRVPDYVVGNLEEAARIIIAQAGEYQQ